MYKTPVSATSLAACIKINSCYIPEKIPRIMCSVNVGCIRIVLANHFNTSENSTYLLHNRMSYDTECIFNVVVFHFECSSMRG